VVFFPGKLRVADAIARALHVEAEHAVAQALAIVAEVAVRALGAEIALEAASYEVRVVAFDAEG
jgi:hypothetical protein